MPGVADVDRPAPARRAAEARSRAIRHRAPPGAGRLELGRRRRAPRPRSRVERGVGRVEVVARSAVAPSPIAPSSAARWRDRLVGRRRERPRSGPAGPKRVIRRHRRRPTTRRGRARGRSRRRARPPSAPATQSEIAPVRMSGAGIQGHVLDVDAARGRARARSRPRSRAGSRPRSAARGASPPARSDSSSRRRSSRAARVPGADRVARRRSGSARAASLSRVRDARRSRAATASRLVAKMSPQIAGLAPATRVVSRKLGPTSGRRSDSSDERRGRLAGRARWRARAGGG